MNPPSYSYITDINNLSKACQKVLKKGSVGGIDRITVADFATEAEPELMALQAELLAHAYVPEPYMEVKVPKKDNEKRSLGLMTVRDKIVQQVINDALVPFFEPIFLPSSYAYRPQRGVPQAIKRVSDGIKHFNNKWLVRCDIDRFFDNIPHDLLEKQIRYFIKDNDLVQLIMLCMGMGKVSKTGSKWQATNGKGVAQGGILSPLLANIYLHQLDSFIRNLHKPIGYVRYADDFVVLTRDKNLADSMSQTITAFLTDKLGLVLDEKEVKSVEEGFLFLGLWFNTEGYGLDDAKQKELCFKIEETLYFNEKGINPKFFEVVEGIRRYHGQLLKPEILRFFDEKIVEIAHQRLQKVPLETSQKQKRLWIEKLDFLTNPFRQAKQRMASAMCKPNAPLFTLERPTPPIASPSPPPPNASSNTNPFPISTAADPPPFFNSEIDKKHEETPSPQPLKQDKNALKTLPKPAEPPTPQGVNEALEINPKKLIAQKRREYEKREAVSLELVITQPGVSLGVMNRRITAKYQGQNLLKNPTANVRHISVMARGVSLSSNVIEHCAEQRIPIVFFGHDNKPQSIIFNADSSDNDLWLAQSEAHRNGIAVKIAKTIAEAKITNQANLLKYCAKHNQRTETDFINSLEKTLLELQKSANLMLQLPDKTPLDKIRLQIMAYEGNAAQSYWQQFKTLVADETDFEKREHQGARDLVNMLLNYGYGILYGRMWSAVLNARLNPSVSFLHTPQYNKPTLVFDMVEVFRAPIVDRSILALINRQEKLTLEQGKLSMDTRRRLAEKILERINTVENFRGQRIRLGDIMRLQAVHLSQYLRGEIKTYKPYLMKW